MRLAVIPARGGSKRIIDKNIKFFGGKPLIAWSIEAAIACNIFEKIIVSTDSEKIAKLAIEYGAEAPFLRPIELANDYVPITPVVAHTINWCISQGMSPSDVCCISATAPFIQVADICQGLEILNQATCDYVLSVTSYSFPIQRAVRIFDNRMEMFNPEFFLTRSQDLEPAYHDAAQFYWGNSSTWQSEKPLFSKNSIPLILPRFRVQDIDTLEDWECAELMFKAIINKTCEQ